MNDPKAIEAALWRVRQTDSDRMSWVVAAQATAGAFLDAAAFVVAAILAFADRLLGQGTEGNALGMALQSR